ncbi:MAG: Ig-like domain-containing protein [Mycobacterium sp.]
MNFKSHSPANLTMPYLRPATALWSAWANRSPCVSTKSIPDRLAAEKAITVVTDPPVEGAFYWLSNSEVRWRPQNFWEPGTRVTVKVNTYVDSGEGLYGQENLSSSFSIGDRLIATRR